MILKATREGVPARGEEARRHALLLALNFSVDAEKRPPAGGAPTAASRYACPLEGASAEHLLAGMLERAPFRGPELQVDGLWTSALRGRYR